MTGYIQRLLPLSSQDHGHQLPNNNLNLTLVFNPEVVEILIREL